MEPPGQASLPQLYKLGWMHQHWVSGCAPASARCEDGSYSEPISLRASSALELRFPL